MYVRDVPILYGTQVINNKVSYTHIGRGSRVHVGDDRLCTQYSRIRLLARNLDSLRQYGYSGKRGHSGNRGIQISTGVQISTGTHYEELRKKIREKNWYGNVM